MSARQVHVINHPLVQHKLTLMRRKDTSTKSFRELVHEISAMLAYEITRDMPMQEIEIETPLEPMKSRVIDGKKVDVSETMQLRPGIPQTTSTFNGTSEGDAWLAGLQLNYLF